MLTFPFHPANRLLFSCVHLLFCCLVLASQLVLLPSGTKAWIILSNGCEYGQLWTPWMVSNSYVCTSACLEDVIYTCTVDQRLGKCIPHMRAMNQIKMATALQEEEEELLCQPDFVQS